jgi:hypothetical protein
MSFGRTLQKITGTGLAQPRIWWRWFAPVAIAAVVAACAQDMSLGPGSDALECSASHVYESVESKIECVRAADERTCKCFRDGALVETCSTNVIDACALGENCCGIGAEPPAEEPEQGPAVGAVSCSTQIVDDQGSLSISCQGTPGQVMCTCQRDGVPSQCAQEQAICTAGATCCS